MEAIFGVLLIFEAISRAPEFADAELCPAQDRDRRRCRRCRSRCSLGRQGCCCARSTGMTEAAGGDRDDQEEA